MNNKKFYALVIIMLIVTCYSIVSPLYAKYTYSVSGNSQATAAKFVIGFEEDSNVLNIPMDLVDDNQKYYFEVANNNSDGLLEVTTSYNFTLETFGNLPLVFNLYKFNPETSDYDILADFDSNISEDFILDFNSEQNDKFMLDIQWDIEEKDYRYSDTIDYILIRLNAVQVD